MPTPWTRYHSVRECTIPPLVPHQSVRASGENVILVGRSLRSQADWILVINGQSATFFKRSLDSAFEAGSSHSNESRDGLGLSKSIGATD